MTVVIRQEEPGDQQMVFDVNVVAFDGDEEAVLAEQLREGGFVVASLVAVLDEQVVGHILFSRLHIETPTDRIPALSLAPMAVHPAHQRQGIGSRLVEEGLDSVRNQGERIVIVLGHPGFYPRFGFTPESATPLQSPFSGSSWMALELAPHALSGIAGQARYAPPFGIV